VAWIALGWALGGRRKPSWKPRHHFRVALGHSCDLRGLVTGTALSLIRAPLEMTDVFIRDGLLWTLFSGAFSQLFNVTGNVFAGLV